MRGYKMFFILSIIINATAGFLALLPFIILLEILAWKQIPALPLKHIAAGGVLCFFMSAILSVTGVPCIFSLQLHVALNLIPFADIGSNTLQYIENMILFLPLGLLLPLLFPRYQKLRYCVLYCFLFSLAVELWQLFSFRVTDSDDLIMNTLGAVAGYGIFSLIRRLYPPIARDFTLPDKCLKEYPSLRFEMVFLTAAVWAGALFLTSFVKNLIWEIFL